MYKSFFYNNYTISYQKFGTLKPLLVLVHGFPEDGTVFKNQYEFLKENYTIIIPDLPGSGKSDINPNLHAVEDFAEIIELILLQENIEQCYLFGHSMGGYISLAFAEKYPKRLLGLGFIHSTSFEDGAEKKENRKRIIDLMEKYGGHYFLKTMIPNLFSEVFSEVNRNVIDELIEKGKSFETKTLQQYYFMMMNRKDRRDVLQKLDVPILFIIGEKDNAIPVSEILQQSSLPKISFIKILSNIAHMGFLEDSEMVNETIWQFIAI